MAWYKHVKGSGVILGWRVGDWRGVGGGPARLPKRHLPFYKEFTASCGQSLTPAHSSLKEGEKEEVRHRQGRKTGDLTDKLPSLPYCSSVKWKECSRDEPVSLPLLTGTRKRVIAGGKMERIMLDLAVWRKWTLLFHLLRNWLISHEKTVYMGLPTCSVDQLALRELRSALWPL